MARPYKIWFRKQTGWWMVEIGGKQEKLARGRENRDEAERKFHELMVERARQPEASDARTADVIEAFLRWSRINTAEDTHRLHKYYCQLFAEACGQIAARQLKPFHVSRWVDGKVEKGEWHETTAFNAKKTAFRVFSWAAQEGMLPANPLSGMKRPKPPPRQRALYPIEFSKLFQHASDPFRDYLLAMQQTGARPKEIRDLKWDQVFEDRWVLGKHKTRKKTGKLRVIILSDIMKAMMERLRATATSDYVFLNCKGQPWTMNAVRLQMYRLKKRLGLSEDVCAYLIRHGFGTQAILSGVDPSTLMELMGHTSLEMISKVYVHLADHHEHLKDAVEKSSHFATMPAPDASGPARRRARPLQPEDGKGEEE